MSGLKCNISLIIVLVSLFSGQAFSQQTGYNDSIPRYNPQPANLKPGLHYSLGSTFVVVPRLGSFTGFTISPYLSIPLSPKLSVDGGIIAGRFYPSFRNLSPEAGMSGHAFNGLAVYGSASYHANSRLTLYGAGIKQFAGSAPSYLLPKSSYTLGSTYNFGSFSLGFALQMSEWDNTGSPFPMNGSQGFYAPFGQRPGTLGTFGR
jgi:hypothetical protein